MPIPMMFDWGETKASLWFSFRVPAASAQNTDITITRHYMKVNKAPHFFECDFFDDIDFRHNKTSVKFEAGNIFVVLMKDQTSKYIWNGFKIMPGQKFGPADDLKEGLTAVQLRDRRIAAEAEYKSHLLQLREDKERVKVEINQTAQNEQWRSEKELRQALETRKESEHQEAAQAIEQLIQEEATPAVVKPEPTEDIRTEKEGDRKNIESHVYDKYAPEAEKEEVDSDDDEEEVERKRVAKEQARFQELEDRKQAEARRSLARRSAEDQEYQKVKQQEEEERRAIAEKLRLSPGGLELAPMNASRQTRLEKKGELPPVREMDSIQGQQVEKILASVGGLSLTANPASVLAGQKSEHVARSTTIKLTMTKKLLPNVPTREQHLLQQPMPKQGGGLASGGSRDENNPIWIKDQADNFFRVGDFGSAVEAYREAVDVASSKTQPGASAGQVDEWCARALSNLSESLIHLGRVDEAKTTLDEAMYKLTLAAQARADSSQNAAAAPAVSRQPGLAPRPPVMDAASHRLWASMRARQAHAYMLGGDFPMAEACLLDALAVPEALQDVLRTSLEQTLEKLREGVKQQREEGQREEGQRGETSSQ